MVMSSRGFSYFTCMSLALESDELVEVAGFCRY